MALLKHSFTPQVKQHLLVLALGCPHNKAMLDTKKAVGIRLKEALKRRNLSNTDLANAERVSIQAVGEWTRTGKIAGERVASISKFLSVSTDWLLTGIPEESAEVSRSPVGIPVVGTSQGGPDHAWLEMGYPPGFGDEYLNVTSRDHHAYALRVRGNSMAPRIREGDVILVEPTTTPDPGDDVVVKTRDGQVMVKTLVSSRNDEIILDSIAKDYDRIVLPSSKVEFIHAVMGVFPPKSIYKR